MDTLLEAGHLVATQADGHCVCPGQQERLVQEAELHHEA